MTETAIQNALLEARSFVERQKLLKQLWHIQQSRAAATSGKSARANTR